jgi:hypothetical protein
MAMSSWFANIAQWWTALPPEWQFLFGLPFAVVAVAFVAHWPTHGPQPASGAAQPAPFRRARRRARRMRA